MRCRGNEGGAVYSVVPNTAIVHRTLELQWSPVELHWSPSGLQWTPLDSMWTPLDSPLELHCPLDTPVTFFFTGASLEP